MNLHENQTLSRIYQIASQIARQGGRAYFVGGCVRDSILNRNITDYDIEVYGIAPSYLESLLSKFGAVHEYGKSFGIFSIRGLNAEFALPRTEYLQAVDAENKRVILSEAPSKQQKASIERQYPKYRITVLPNYPFRHTDFAVIINPDASPAEAALRRDFTINSILKDVITGEIKDCYGGISDIDSKTIRHIDAHTFVQDPLRALRAAQFAGRLGFSIAPETKVLCASLSLQMLPIERIRCELKKLLQSPYPKLGFDFLLNTQLLRQLSENWFQSFQCTFNFFSSSVPLCDIIPNLLLPWEAEANTALLLLPLLISNLQISPVLKLLCGSRQEEEKQKVIASQIQEFITCPNAYTIRKAAYFHVLDPLLKISSSIAQYTGNPNPATQIACELSGELNSTPLLTGKDLIECGIAPSPAYAKILQYARELQFHGYTKSQIIQNIKQNIQQFFNKNIN